MQGNQSSNPPHSLSLRLHTRQPSICSNIAIPEGRSLCCLLCSQTCYRASRRYTKRGPLPLLGNRGLDLECTRRTRIRAKVDDWFPLARLLFAEVEILLANITKHVRPVSSRPFPRDRDLIYTLHLRCPKLVYISTALSSQDPISWDDKTSLRIILEERSSLVNSFSQVPGTYKSSRVFSQTQGYSRCIEWVESLWTPIFF